MGVGDIASALRIDFGTLSPMLKRIESKGLVTRRRKLTDERRVLVNLTPKGVSLRKRTEQMLGEFYCFLNMPLDELFDLKDRLHNFVNSAGPKELRMTPTKNIGASFLSCSSHAYKPEILTSKFANAGHRGSTLACRADENDEVWKSHIIDDAEGLRFLSVVGICCTAYVAVWLPAQPIDATQALNLSAGVLNCKVSRGRSLS